MDQDDGTDDGNELLSARPKAHRIDLLPSKVSSMDQLTTKSSDSPASSSKGSAGSPSKSLCSSSSTSSENMPSAQEMKVAHAKFAYCINF